MKKYVAALRALSMHLKSHVWIAIKRRAWDRERNIDACSNGDWFRRIDSISRGPNRRGSAHVPWPIVEPEWKRRLAVWLFCTRSPSWSFPISTPSAPFLSVCPSVLLSDHRSENVWLAPKFLGESFMESCPRKSGCSPPSSSSSAPHVVNPTCTIRNCSGLFYLNCHRDSWAEQQLIQHSSHLWKCWGDWRRPLAPVGSCLWWGLWRWPVLCFSSSPRLQQH